MWKSAPYRSPLRKLGVKTQLLETELGHLSFEQYRELLVVMDKYTIVFKDRPSLATSVVQDINVGDPPPAKQSPYRVHPHKAPLIQKEIDAILLMGLNRPGATNTSRGHNRSSLLTPELRAAAKELKDNNDIVIRRADKSHIFVLLDKEDYLSKMSRILDDTKKFKKITINPTDGLKVKLNRLIRTNNALTGAPKLPLIEGDHKLGYIYGNVKTHESNQPLRPIISQIPAVTYKLAKCLHALISPFTPSSFSLKSTEEFLDIIKTSRPSGIIASMDVESPFTHVPINETVNLIFSRLYRSDEIHFPIPEDILRQLLQACTKEVPFYGPDKNMYVQIDGVAMGSPLGVLFANFYMGSIEETIFTQHHELKPSIYTRYVDDIFISADTEDSVSQIIEMFEENSSLNYTHKIEIERKLPFLDTVVHRGTDSFSTEVYVKPTNLGFR
ncbi:uncharacterized protein LOC143040785 [Oratosquilla oratoria]|uniref:uncharacterized protein LOC143040785 n=1 Tax=Oratosquilla oratoria TaxID=337810 RepID=UPI003F765D6E